MHESNVIATWGCNFAHILYIAVYEIWKHYISNTGPFNKY